MNKLDHKFEPMKRDPRYCGHMSMMRPVGSPDYGTVHMSVECGYPPSAHVETESESNTDV